MPPFIRRKTLPTLVGAATRNRLAAPQPLERRRAAWQERVWELFDVVPEVSDAFDNYGNLLTKVRWYAGFRLRDDDAPVPMEDLLNDPELLAEAGISPQMAATAIDLVARVRSPEGGQDAIKKELAINIGLPGEAYLVGARDPETGAEWWQVFSIDELAYDSTRKQWLFREMPGDIVTYRPLPPDSTVLRFWSPHPRFTNLPYSRMRAALDDAEELQLLAQGNRAVAQNRIANAGLVLYNRTKLKPRPMNPQPGANTNPQATDDPVFARVAEMWMAAISQPDNASAVVPGFFGVDGDPTGLLEHVTFDRPLDDTVLERMKTCLSRLAHALPLPKEMALGAEASNHWNLWQFTDDQFRTYLEPGVRLQVDGLTDSWVQPGMRAAFSQLTADPALLDRIVCWYDPAALVVRPNRVNDLVLAHDRYVISDAYLRDAMAVPEDAAPDEAELERRKALASAGAGKAGVPGGPAGIRPASDTQAPPPEIVPAATERLALTAGAAANPFGSLGNDLAAIDRSLFDRVMVRADSALADALRVAGARLRSAAQNTPHAKKLRGLRAEDVAATLGPVACAEVAPPDEMLRDSFAPLELTFTSWVEAAQTDVRYTIRQAALAADVTVDEVAMARAEAEQDRHREEAWLFLLAGLLALARRVIYSPEAPAPLPGEEGEFDALQTVPAALIRQALAIAGGTSGITATTSGGLVTVSGAGSAPVGGVAAGIDADAILRDVLRATTTGWTWQWAAFGAPKAPFEPHRSLNGQEFASWEDPVLANTGGVWPYVGFFYPGDHRFCRCSFVKTIAPVSAAAAAR